MKFNVKKFVVILACISLCSFIISGIILYLTGGISAVSIKTMEVNKSKEFDVDSVEKIIVKTIDADVNIISATDKIIKADFYGNVKTNLIGALPDLKTQLEGGILIIEVTYPLTITLGLIDLSKLNLDVYIPNDFSKEIIVNSVSGNLEINKFNIESFLFKSTSGEIIAKDLIAQNVKIETTSGRVLIKDIDGKIIVNTVSGEVNVELKSLKKDIDIKTVSGSINLKIPKNSHFLFAVSSVSGDIKNDFSAKITFADKRSFEGIVGQGIHKLILKSISGDISLFPN